MIRAGVSIVAATLGALAGSPAAACSIDMRPVREGIERIKADPDVRLVEGAISRLYRADAAEPAPKETTE